MNRTYSLKRHKEFRYTYRAGRRVNAGCFALVTARNRSGKVQVGFSVSKKVGSSVERNRCKRRLKAAYTPFLPLTQPGRNLIFIARREALFLPFDRMQNEICKALQKAGLYKEEPAGEVSP